MRTWRTLRWCLVGAPPAWQDLDQGGPYQAGFVTLVHTDPRGKELTIDVWYPALPEPGDEPESYWPDLEFVFSAFRDAPPDTRGAPYPLAAFSHGYGGIRYQSPYLTEHPARHGFVVAAPDHTHNTFMDLDMNYAAQVLSERPGDVRYTVAGPGPPGHDRGAHLGVRGVGP